METGPFRRFTVRFAVSAALAVSGCVSAADGPSPTDPHPTTTTLPPTTTTTLTLTTSLEDYRACLDGNGVTIAQIPIDGRGRPRLAPAIEALDLSDRIVIEALGECAPILTTGALDTTADFHLEALVMSALEEYAGCMRRNGVTDFPDPIAGFDGVGSPFDPTAIPWDDDGLGHAVTVCSALLAQLSS